MPLSPPPTVPRCHRQEQSWAVGLARRRMQARYRPHGGRVRGAANQQPHSRSGTRTRACDS
eukprot:6214263-Pleurochrysis_carterae.AAC.2